MPTRDELANALRKADAAGNAMDAKRLADAIRAMDASGGAAPAPAMQMQPAPKPAPMQMQPVKPAPQSGGAGPAPVNPSITPLGGTGEWDLSKFEALPRPAPTAAMVNAENPIVAEQRRQQALAGRNFAAQQPERMAKEQRWKDELAAMNAAGVVTFKSNGPDAPLELNQERPDYLASRAIASGVNTNIGGANAAITMSQQLANAYGAGFDPSMQGAMAGNEFGVGAMDAPERFADAAFKGGYAQNQQTINERGDVIPSIPMQPAQTGGEMGADIVGALGGYIVGPGNVITKPAREIGEAMRAVPGLSRTARGVGGEVLENAGHAYAFGASAAPPGSDRNMAGLDVATDPLSYLGIEALRAIPRGLKALGDMPIPTNAGAARPGPIDTTTLEPRPPAAAPSVAPTPANAPAPYPRPDMEAAQSAPPRAPTATAQAAGAPPIQPPPPAVAAANAAVPTPGVAPPAGTLTPVGNGVAVDSFNALPVKTREGVLRALEASGMNRQQAFDAIRSLNDLPPDRANMFEFELIRRFGGPDKFPNLQANLTTMGSDFSIQTPRKGGSPQDVMNKSLLEQAQSEGDYLTRTAEQLFGEGKVATKEELDAFRTQLGGRYRTQLAETYPGMTRLRNADSKKALAQTVDAGRKNLTDYLLRPDVIEQVPPWVQDQVMMQVSDDLRWLQKDDAGLQFASRANPELSPLLTSDQTLRYSPQLWKTLVQMYPTQVGHSLQSAYRAAIDDAFSGVSNAVDRTTAKKLMRLRGQSRVRANAADPNKRGFGLLHLLEEASPGYKKIRQEYGDVVGAQKAADMPDTFFRVAKDEEALADFADVFENELTPLQQNAVRNGITTQIRQALKNKTEFTQPWELGAVDRGHIPNLTAVSSQPFLEALPKVFGRDGERMADAIRLSRANVDNIQAINKSFASGTPKGVDITKNAKNLYEHPSATDINPIDNITSTLGGLGATGMFVPGAQGAAAMALGAGGLRALYRAYKRGKSLSPSQKEALAEWLFKPRRETDAMPPSTPRGFSKLGYAGNVVTGAGIGATTGAMSSGGDPTTTAEGALLGALGGGARAGLRARRANASIIKPPGPRPRGGPPRSFGNRVAMAPAAPQIARPLPGQTSPASPTGTGIVAGGLIGAAAPADNDQDRLRNAAIGAGVLGLAGNRLGRLGSKPPKPPKGAPVPKAPVAAEVRASSSPSTVTPIGKGAGLKVGAYDETIGAARVQYSVGDDGSMYIGQFKVPPEARGQGEASRALDQLLKKADENGSAVSLHVSDSGGMTEKQLIAFYERRGFKKTSDDKYNTEMVRPPSTVSPFKPGAVANDTPPKGQATPGVNGLFRTLSSYSREVVYRQAGPAIQDAIDAGRYASTQRARGVPDVEIAARLGTDVDKLDGYVKLSTPFDGVRLSRDSNIPPNLLNLSPEVRRALDGVENFVRGFTGSGRSRRAYAEADRAAEAKIAKPTPKPPVVKNGVGSLGADKINMDRSMGAKRAFVGPAKIRYIVDDRGVTISEMSVPREARGQGHGGRALDAIIQAADERGLDVGLIAHSFDDGPLSDQQLSAFYASRGFKPNTAHPIEGAMKREARNPPTKNGFGSSKLPMDEGARMARRKSWQAEKGPVDDTPWFHAGNLGDDLSADAGELGLHIGNEDAAKFVQQRGITRKVKPVVSELSVRGTFAKTPDIGNFSSPYMYLRKRGDEPRAFDKRYSQMWAELDQAASTLPKISDPNSPELAKVLKQWRDRVHDAAKRNDISGWEYENYAEGGGDPSRVVFFGDAVRKSDATFDPSQSSSSKLLAGMGGVSPELATAVGTAAYYEANPYDANGDGKIDEQDRAAYLMSAAANAFGVHVGKRALGAGVRKLAGNRLGSRRGPPSEIHQNGIKAYHGSPHDFDKFELSDKTIGTGEGAQAYGHGLYFAENEAVAKGYRDALTNKPHDVIESYVELVARHGRPKGEGATTRGYLESQGFPADDEMVDLVDKAIAGATPAGKATGYTAEAMNALLDRRLSKKGRLYEVDINADPEHFLDWDKPLSEQPAIVEKLKSVPQLARQTALFTSPNARGMNAVLSVGNNKAEAAKILREAGIPGIKFLDQGSRNAGDGTRNYVVFDDSHVNIINKQGFFGGGSKRPPIRSQGFGGGRKGAPANQLSGPPKPKPKGPPMKAEEVALRAALNKKRAAERKVRRETVMLDNRDERRRPAEQDVMQAERDLAEYLDRQYRQKADQARWLDRGVSVAQGGKKIATTVGKVAARELAKDNHTLTKVWGGAAVLGTGVLGANALLSGGGSKKTEEVIPPTDPRYFFEKVKGDTTKASALQNALVSIGLLDAKDAKGGWGSRSNDAMKAWLSKRPDRNPKLPIQDYEAPALLAEAYGGYEENGKWFYDNGEPIVFPLKTEPSGLPMRPMRPDETRRVNYRKKTEAQRSQ